jgi:hypothetical protein
VAAARAIDFVLQRTVQGELTPAEATAMLLSNRPAAALAP